MESQNYELLLHASLKKSQKFPQNIMSFFLHLNRLDQILGRQGSKAKDVYESKQSLASRIVKTERQARQLYIKVITRCVKIVQILCPS